VRRRSSCRLFAGILATISLQAAHAALLQDVELDNAGAVRRAIDSGEATPNSLAREPVNPDPRRRAARRQHGGRSLRAALAETA
jgi:hypothetical protein